MFSQGPIRSFMSDIPDDKWPFPPKEKKVSEIPGQEFEGWWQENVQTEPVMHVQKHTLKND